MTIKASTPWAIIVSQSLICLFTSPAASIMIRLMPSSLALASAASAIFLTKVSEFVLDEKPMVMLLSPSAFVSLAAFSPPSDCAAVVAVVAEEPPQPANMLPVTAKHNATPKIFFFILISSFKLNI